MVKIIITKTTGFQLRGGLGPARRIYDGNVPGAPRKAPRQRGAHPRRNRVVGGARRRLVFGRAPRRAPLGRAPVNRVLF